MLENVKHFLHAKNLLIFKRIIKRGKMPNLKSKKAQLTLFIILAIAIVVLATVLYFVFSKTDIIQKQNEVESYFISCVDEKVKEAVSVAELQGGYLILPEFEQGSESFPFSSYFSFVTLDIPYWTYVTGNGIQKNNPPSLQEIESQFEEYLRVPIMDCSNFRQFSSLDINASGIKNISIRINSGNIETTIFMPLNVKGLDYDYRSSEHKIKTQTKFGSLYNSALQFFKENDQKNILANYSLDVINAYVPTNGLEISCIPKILSKNQVKETLKGALQENIQELKIKGSNFYLKNPENKYFIINLDQPINKQFNFLYLTKWPTYIEVWPSSQDVIKINPIGNQAGLGALGFCFIPYHLVYDLSFPVLIQISDGTEMFQFPVLVIIDKMVPKNFNFNETIQPSFDLCKDPGQIGTIFTKYGSKSVKSEISFRCLSQECDIGQTDKDSDGKLTASFPRCVNGYAIASSPGYKTSEALVSTNQPFILSMQMSKIYELLIQINTESGEKAIISFNSADYSITTVYPDSQSVNLTEGNYNVSVQLFKDSSISIGEQQVEKCISVPVPGIPGMLGLKDKECYNLTLPSSQFTSVPIGGGKIEFFMTDSELKNAKKIKIQSEKIETPKTIEELMNVYDSINLPTLKVTLI